MSKRCFFIEIWEENRELAKGLFVEITIFILLLGILHFGHSYIERLAISQERKEWLDLIHFVFIVLVWTLFLAAFVAYVTIFKIQEFRRRIPALPTNPALDEVTQVASRIQQAVLLEDRNRAATEVERAVASVLSIRDVVRREFSKSCKLDAGGNLHVRVENEVGALHHQVFDQSHRLEVEGVDLREPELLLFTQLMPTDVRRVSYEVEELKKGYMGFRVKFSPPVQPGEFVRYAYEYKHPAFTGLYFDEADPQDWTYAYMAYPTKKLILRVEFPLSYEPIPELFVEHMSTVVQEDVETLLADSALTHVRTEGGALVSQLIVVRPKTGYTYGMGWTKPPRPA